jgi:hypothetical protein
MNDADTRRMESFLRVREFGQLQTAQIPRNSFAAELLTRLSNIITDLENQAATQSSGLRAAQQHSTGKASARDEIFLDLRAIARTARGMALTIPGLEDKFRLPRNLKDQELLSAARSFAADAAPLAAEFIRRGLPADFLEDLNADIATLEQAVTGQIQGTEEHVAATAALDDLIDRGLRTIRELDTVMLNLFATNPATLAQWRGAHHVERAPRRRKQTSPPTP